MHLHNPYLSLTFNDHLCLTQVENRLTGDSFPILDDQQLSVNYNQAEHSTFEIINMLEKADAIHVTVKSNDLWAEVEYHLGENDHFCEKRIQLRASCDLELKSVTAASFTVGEKAISLYAHKYPDFDLIEAQVEKDYHFSITREKNSEPCTTVFIRNQKGGLFSGMELAFAETTVTGQTITHTAHTSMKLKKETVIALEPTYIGVYKKGRHDDQAALFAPNAHVMLNHGAVAQGMEGKAEDGGAGFEKEYQLLPSESQAMLKMTCRLMPPQSKEFRAMACGWHSQFSQRKLNAESLERDLRSIQTLVDCGINWFTHQAPWSGDVEKMNSLQSSDTYHLDENELRFFEAMTETGIKSMFWATVTNTHPWIDEGRPFFSDRPEWLRETGDLEGKWPMQFKGLPSNCVANRPFMERLTAACDQALNSELFSSFAIDGDFFGTGGYFQSTVPVICFSEQHDHLPYDSNYLAQKAFKDLSAHLKEKRPALMIDMFRPVMDLGVWATDNVDAVLGPIETGAGADYIRGGNEIRTEARMRLHHEFLPHHKHMAIIFQSCAIFDSPPQWVSENIEYMMLSAISSAPTVFTYLPAHDGINELDQARIKRWFDWAKENAQFLYAKKDLFYWPGCGQVDGSAHIVDNEGIIFLFNGEDRDLAGEFELTEEEIGVNDDGEYTISQFYPENGKTNSYRYGDKVSWEVPMQSVAVLRVQVVTIPYQALEEEEQQGEILNTIRRRRFEPPAGTPDSASLLREDRLR